MKKFISLGTVLVCGVLLVECSNKEDAEKLTQQSKTVESLSKKNEILSSDIDKKEDIKLSNGDSVNLSGKATVGEEIPAGIYDITADSDFVGIAIDSTNTDWNDYLVMSLDDKKIMKRNVHHII